LPLLIEIIEWIQQKVIEENNMLFLKIIAKTTKNKGVEVYISKSQGDRT
jgi:hypothetical protein